MGYTKSYLLAVFEVSKWIGIAYLLADAWSGFPGAIILCFFAAIVGIAGPIAQSLNEKKNVK